jgi:hypothetical protein
MSAPDEFDPMIERLFSRAPVMADAAEFAQGIERRLHRGAGVRTAALGVAGLIGGVIAVRETVGTNFAFRAQDASDRTIGLVGGGLDNAVSQAQSTVQSGLERFGLGAGVELTSMAGMQLFWVVTAVLIAAATMAMLKLTDQI